MYLHRDAQAFLWWSTFGGYFAIGWIVDLFKIPAMVREVNEDPRFVREFVEKLRKHPKPEFSSFRLLFAIMVGYLWCVLFQMAIPQDHFFGIDWGYLHWLNPLIGALGVWMVGNVGREKGKLWHCLVAAYVTYPIRYVIYDETYWMLGMLTVSALAFDHISKEWRRGPVKRHSLKRRFVPLAAGVCIYLFVWGAYFYFNGKITVDDGEEVPVYEALNNFFNSPWWTDLKQTLSDTWNYARHHGWYETYKQILESLDVDGEQNAFKVNESHCRD